MLLPLYDLNLREVLLDQAFAGVADGIGIDNGKEFGKFGATGGGGHRQRHRILKGGDSPRFVGPVIPFPVGVQFGKLLF